MCGLQKQSEVGKSCLHSLKCSSRHCGISSVSLSLWSIVVPLFSFKSTSTNFFLVMLLCNVKFVVVQIETKGNRVYFDGWLTPQVCISSYLFYARKFLCGNWWFFKANDSLGCSYPGIFEQFDFLMTASTSYFRIFKIENVEEEYFEDKTRTKTWKPFTLRTLWARSKYFVHLSQCDNAINDLEYCKGNK